MLYRKTWLEYMEQKFCKERICKLKDWQGGEIERRFQKAENLWYSESRDYLIYNIFKEEKS